MSKPSCDACTELRAYAPEFVLNGVTDNIAASLKNNTGIAYKNDNCEDLQDVLDCLIGHKIAELESLDVCDWKPFMQGFGPNLYETLKAMLMNECGQWSAMCALLDLMKGGRPKIHRGEWLDSFKNKIELFLTPGGTPFSVENYFPTFDADVQGVSICGDGSRLGRWALSDVKDNVPYPYTVGLRLTAPIEKGEVLGVVPRSAVPESDFTLKRWKEMLRGSGRWQWYNINQDTLWYVTGKGYTKINGVTFNEELAQYGEDNLVFMVDSFIGDSRSGGCWAMTTVETRIYDA